MARQSNRLHPTPGRSLRLGVIIAALLLLTPTAALAATDTQSATVPPTDTDFIETLGVAQFDPQLGTLQSATVTLEGTVVGTMELENTSTSSPSVGTMQLSASFALTQAAGGDLANLDAALPTTEQTFSLTTFDGSVDFAGGSGVSIPAHASDSVTHTVDDAASLAGFIGTSTVGFVVEAVGTSYAIGDTGNIASNFISDASASVTVEYEYVPAGLPAIDIDKSPDLQTVELGGDAPFTITVTNTGPLDLVNVVVTDELSPDCDLVIGDLASGASVSYECTAFGVNEPFTNVAVVTGEDADGNPVSDEDDAVVEVIDVLGIGAILIEKTPDQQTVLTGSDVIFTITVSNAGPVDLVNVTVTDVLAPDCDRVIGDLAVGASVSYECAAPDVTEAFTNVASVTGEDEDGNVVEDEDDADVSVVDDESEIPAISIDKSPDLQTVVVGDDAVFTIAVSNPGPVDLVNVMVTDPLAPDCDAAIGDLAVGETETYQCTAFDVTAPFTNVATATGQDSDGNGVSDSDDARVEVGNVLPLTGFNSSTLALFGLMLLTAGFALVLVARGQARPLQVLLVALFVMLPIVFGARTDAQAADITENHSSSIAPTLTNWTDQFTFPQFDPVQGDLVDVTITLTGSVDATMQVENTSTSSGCVASHEWRSVVSMETPSGDLVVAPDDAATVALGDFDGAVDFTGASGASFSAGGALDAGTITITDAAALEAFVGYGTIELAAAASGATKVTGCGNISQVVTTIAAADAELVYRYETAPAEPAIDIEKYTNGEDADDPTGPEIPVGDDVLWEYVVTNTGAVNLRRIVVSDDQGVSVSCPQDVLTVGESMVCEGAGIAVPGQYANVGSVVGSTQDGVQVFDEDPSHYFGVTVTHPEPAIDIEKHTNGEDADVPTGPAIAVGAPVLWEYFVTNTGNVDLVDIDVTDDKGVAVTCPGTELGVGGAMTCTGSGVAKRGQYANVGTVTGVAPDGSVVDDRDPSHYVGFTVKTWLDCSHAEVGCLGIGGEAPGPVQVFIDGVEIDCQESSQPGTIMVHFTCMVDSRELAPTVTVEIYGAGQLLWVGTDLNTICQEVPPPPPPGRPSAP